MEFNDAFIVTPGTIIDWDDTKETINRAKHKHSLESAAYGLEQVLFQNAHHIYRFSESKIDNEQRINFIFEDEFKELVFCVIKQVNPTLIRIISVRKASKNERQKFNNYFNLNK